MCEACQAVLPPQARFCLECGAAVVAHGGEETRRTVTLVFTDVTGSTSMGESLDPEALRELMGRYFDVARRAVERHGGTVEKFVGDAVLAVFGVPQVHEDDALRAVRAAAELNEAVGELADELEHGLGVRLSIRTGVNTGSVVTGAARSGGSFATGDAVNTAARLEQAAGPGEVLLGPETYLLVRDAVEVGPVREVEAKGKSESVPARLLLRVDGLASGRSRRVDVPLVGRDRELRTLEDALARTVASGRGHLVTVVGGPGLGKTRLVTDFIAGVHGRARVMEGRCVSYGSGLTFWPLAQALNQVLGLSGRESPEVVHTALVDTLEGTPDADEVAGLVTSLLVAPAAPTDTPTGTDHSWWAVSRLVEHLALRHPLVVVIDDLHWAEALLVELLEHVQDETRDLPVLLVCSARPEVLETHPSWGQASLNAVTLALEPFDEALTRRSLAGHLEGEVSDEVARAVAAWSGGNPLFVEEVVVHLLESGLLVRGESGWEAAGALDRAGVPPSITALLGARLDRLPAEERRLLERLSVVGMEVKLAEARAFNKPADHDRLPGLLASLTRRDLLRRLRSAGGGTWTFRHVMVRDAAYESLPKARRVRLHEAFASHLQENVLEGGAEHSAFVAHHLEQAARHARGLAANAEATGELAVRAVTALVEAAQEARDRGDLGASGALLGRAADLESPHREQHRTVLRRLVHHHTQLQQVSKTKIAIDRFEAALDPSPSALDAAFLRCMRLHNRIEAAEDIEPGMLQVAAKELLEESRRAGDTLCEVKALFSLCTVQVLAARWGRIEELVAQIAEAGDIEDRRKTQVLNLAGLYHGPAPTTRGLERTRLLLTEARSPQERAALRLVEAAALAALGDPTGPSRLAECRTRALEAGSLDLGLQLHVAEALALLDDPGAAAEAAAAPVSAMIEAGDYAVASTYLAWRAVLLHEGGADVSVVEPMLVQAAAWTVPHDVISTIMVPIGRCLVAEAHGQLEDAVRFAHEALTLVDDTEEVQLLGNVRRWLSAVFERQGDLSTARRLLVEAHAIYEAKECLVLAAAVRARLDELDVS